MQGSRLSTFNRRTLVILAGTCVVGVLALSFPWLLFVLLLEAAVLVIWLGRQAIRATNVDELDVFISQTGLPDTPAVREQIANFLQRTRSLRFGWTWLSTVGFIVIELAITGHIGIGLATFMAGLTGFYVGTLVAELHGLRIRRREGVTTVLLENRNVSLFSTSNLNHYLWVVTALTVAATTMQFFLIDDEVIWSIVVLTMAIAVLCVTQVAQHGVAIRARTLLDADTVATDNAIRTVVIEGIRLTGLALAVLTLGWAANIFAVDLIHDNAGFLFIVIGLATWSLGLAYRATLLRPPTRVEARL